VLRHWPDAAVIGVLLVMNVAVAFTEERQAANAIAALKQRLAATAGAHDQAGKCRRARRSGQPAR